MDTQKVKILDVQTQNSVKNVKSLKTQIRELKEQLGQLEKGTEEYNAVAQQLANTNQKQIEINEAMKYSNKDFGASMSNLTRVATGVIGAFNGVNAVMAMMGSDSEEAQEALKNIQLTMALIQGMSAIDTAIKSLKGLGNAFNTIGTAEQIAGTAALATAENNLQKEMAETTAAANVETGAIAANTAAKATNAGATNAMGVAEGTALKGATKGVGVFGKLGNVFKGVGTAAKSAAAALGWVGVAIAAVVAALAIYTAIQKKANKERKEAMDFNSNILASYREQSQEVMALTGALNDENVSLENKKAIIEKLNKTIPEFNGKLNETTGEITYNNKALQDYLKNLKAKITYEAYQDKINSKLKEQAELQMKINKRMNDGWGNLFGRITRLEKKIKKADDEVNNLVKDMLKINLDDAFDDNKITKNTGKTLKEIAKEIKVIYQALVETIFDEREFTKIYNGVWDKSDVLLDRIKRNIRTKDLGTVIIDGIERKIEDSPNVQKLLNASKHPVVTKFEVTADFIFGEDVIEKLEKNLIDEEEKLKKKVDADGRKLTEKELTQLKEDVELRKTQLTNMKALAEAVQEYANYQTELDEGMKERVRLEDEYAQTLAIEKQYIKETRGNDRFAEINKEIATSEQLLQTIYDRIDAEQKEYDILRNKAVLNKIESERLDELDQKLLEDKKAKHNTEVALDNAYYKKRLEEIKKHYEDLEEEYDQYAADIENKRTRRGFGTQDYNTQLDILKLQEEQLKEQLAYVDWYYDVLMANVEEGNDEWKRLEAEKNAAILDLDRQLEQQRAEIVKEGYTSRINAIKTYYNTLSTITGQIQSLLDEEMAGMDENSAEYKKYKLINARIDVASGVLAAFMSGIESGVPWPYNLIVAAAMAGLVGATGIAQLKNIENEQAKNSMTSSTTNPVTIGSEYDTLSYMQNADILSSIQDQRVYVTESDISSTQRRVQVTESSATF